MKKIIAVLLVLLLAAALITSCKKDNDIINNSDPTGTGNTQSDTTVAVNGSETTVDSAHSSEEAMNGDEFTNDNEAVYKDAWD